MKIIKIGRNPEEMTARVGCTGCGTVISVQRCECDHNSSRRLNEDWYAVKCPTCDERISIYPVQFK